MPRIGFVINPIAGMGGCVGLKGTDGVVAEAERRGAERVATARALEMLVTLKRLLDAESVPPAIHWLTAAGDMGSETLRTAGITAVETVYRAAGATSALDTKAAVEKFVAAGVDLILFCGGDGTARDICSIFGETTPMLGIPAGVKMYSGVFGVTPTRTAEIFFLPTLSPTRKGWRPSWKMPWC
jgi:predicted polyphosphate/ATP-dependent NAD kinase